MITVLENNNSAICLRKRRIGTGIIQFDGTSLKEILISFRDMPDLIEIMKQHLEDFEASEKKAQENPLYRHSE